MSDDPQDPNNPLPHRPAAQRGDVGGELLGLDVLQANSPTSSWLSARPIPSSILSIAYWGSP